MKSLLIALFSFCLTSCLATYCNGQQLKLGNNPTQINKSALLELESWNQGLRLTRVDTGAVNNVIGTLSPAQQDSTNGMIVYQISDSCLYYRSGGIWHRLIISDSLGIVSLNGDKTHSQTFALTKNSGSLGISNSLAGSHILNIPLASNTDTGLITPNAQTINGTKTLLRSPSVSTLTPGSIVYIGDNDSLAEDNDNLYWNKDRHRLGIGIHPDTTLEINSGTAGKSGIRINRLTPSSSADSALLGINSNGDIIKIGDIYKINATISDSYTAPLLGGLLNAAALVTEVSDSIKFNAAAMGSTVIVNPRSGLIPGMWVSNARVSTPGFIRVDIFIDNGLLGALLGKTFDINLNIDITLIQ